MSIVVNDLVNENSVIVCGIQRIDGTSKTGNDYHLIQFHGLKKPDGFGADSCIGFQTVSDLTIDAKDFDKYIPDVQLGDEVLFGFSRANSYVDGNGKVKSYQKLVFAQIMQTKKK